MRFPPEQVHAAAFLFEKENGNVLGNYEEGVVADSKLEGRDPRELKKELIESVTFPTELNEQDRTPVYWVLSKTFDSELIEWWTSQLRKEVEDETGCVFQILIALDNLEEPVFGKGRSSRSICETELNLRDARNYLDGKETQQVGWLNNDDTDCIHHDRG